MRVVHIFFRGLISFFSTSIRSIPFIPTRYFLRQAYKKPAHTGLLHGNKAQALMEYILIVAIIALVCMSGAKIFQMGLVNAFKNFITILQIPIP
jgi:Flp pilus assembly pilin Flp